MEDILITLLNELGEIAKIDEIGVPCGTAVIVNYIGCEKKEPCLYLSFKGSTIIWQKQKIDLNEPGSVDHMRSLLRVRYESRHND